ncbi:MAG: OprO/OprP family phosphate-selective porin [Gemmatimonadetes bacterium]|nr:OprO/OprP family phosphate-selective porin [Gemmatimonadota bacterium]
MKGTVGGALLLLLGGAAGGAAQVVQAGPLTLDFTGRAQVQSNTTSIGDDELGEGNGPATAAFETRRIRFGTAFAFEDWITGVLEVDFGGGAASLTDAYIDVELSEAFGVAAGQQKKPFGLFELTSNTKILTIERTARIRGLEEYLGALPGDAHTLLDEGRYLGRDIGVVVHGEAGRVGYAGGVFNGSGPNAREELGSKAYAGRLALGVTEAVVVGAAVSRQPTGRDGPDGDELIGTAWAIDAELGGFREPGMHLMAEVMGGDGPALTPGAEMPRMLGAQAAAGWFVQRTGRVEGVEPVLRVSWGDPDTDADSEAGALITPGVNLYFTGRNRLMLNGDLYVPSQDGLDTQYGVLAQLQIYF